MSGYQWLGVGLVALVVLLMVVVSVQIVRSYLGDWAALRRDLRTQLGSAGMGIALSLIIITGLWLIFGRPA